MLGNRSRPRIRLPNQWPSRVRSGVLHAISLAHFSLTFTRSWAANSRNARIRLKQENDRLQQELALLIEEMRIKDARMERIPAQRRPHYPPIERLAILELRAARGWSMSQTARRLLVTTATVSSWMIRLDEDGPRAIVQVRVPVNKFPEFVGYIVRRLKVLCPSMGRVKIAQVLCRGGSAPRAHNGTADAETGSHPTADSDSRSRLSCRHCDAPESRLALRPHGSADLPRLLVFLDPLRAAPTLALLLVARRGRRSLLAQDHGLHGVRAAADVRRDQDIPRTGHPASWNGAATPDHRSGNAVHRRGLRAVVHSPGHPATIRRRRQVRQHRGHRTADANDQERVYPEVPDPLQSREVPTRAVAVRDLVQPRSSERGARRSNA